MTLAEWIEQRGHGAKAFLARETGLSWQAIHSASSGLVAMRYENAQRIHAATGGEVSIETLCTRQPVAS